MKKIFVVLLFMFPVTHVWAQSGKHLHLEKVYQDSWCRANGGELEVLLNDKTRVDCVTPDYAIEFDFAKKWAESIGQSLHYGMVLNKKPGIVLIMENGDKDKKYLNRVGIVAQRNHIALWTITPRDLQLNYN